MEKLLVWDGSFPFNFESNGEIMKRVVKHLLPITALTILASPMAKASSAYCDLQYQVRFDFSSVAFEKPVRMVVAHAGIGRGDHPQESGIQDRKDIFLTLHEDRFTGLQSFKSEWGTHGDAKFTAYPKVFVQYDVFFEDGSQMATDLTPVETDDPSLDGAFPPFGKTMANKFSECRSS
jgi:hypothetical protein